jgi:hypothetical protein
MNNNPMPMDLALTLLKGMKAEYKNLNDHPNGYAIDKVLNAVFDLRLALEGMIELYHDGCDPDDAPDVYWNAIRVMGETKW